MKRRVADLLLAEGFLASVQETGDGAKKFLEIEIKYLPNGTTPVIKGLQRVSSPGQRRYASFDAIPRVRSGLGLSILSTSRGVMTDREARKQKVGGEIICTVW
jgi:small subunit ribosomal protein S8